MARRYQAQSIVDGETIVDVVVVVESFFGGKVQFDDSDRM
jgi:hypothetical protein